MSDTMVHKNVVGVRVTTTSGFAVANLRNCNIEGNTHGVDASTNAFVTINSSRISNDSTNGVRTSATGAQLSISESVISNNGTGINANAGSVISVLSNQILFNSTGFGGTTSLISSDGQNRSAGNSVPGSPTGPAVTIQ